MPIRRSIARALLRLAGWTLVGEMPPRGILVGAPHTSQWDFAAFLLIAWANGVQPKVLVKQSFFKGPLGPILRATGGISLDRANPGQTIRQLLKDAAGHPSFLLVLAAEGTRTPVKYWKPGFYRISQQTGLPIVLGFVDGPTKTMGLGPSLTPSGDLVADMDRVRAFYADKQGFRPDGRPAPRLREELDGSL